jgi:hypothetical protein
MVSFETLARLAVPELLTQFLSGGLDARELHIGGLRAGSVTFTAPAVLLNGYSVVPGVRISAVLRSGDEDEADGEQDTPTEPVVLRIGGDAAARGHLRIGERWTTGRLGGQPVRIRNAVLERETSARASAQAPLPPLPPLQSLAASVERAAALGPRGAAR